MKADVRMMISLSTEAYAWLSERSQRTGATRAAIVRIVLREAMVAEQAAVAGQDDAERRRIAR